MSDQMQNKWQEKGGKERSGRLPFAPLIACVGGQGHWRTSKSKGMKFLGVQSRAIEGEDPFSGLSPQVIDNI